MDNNSFRKLVIGHISFLTKVSQEKINDSMRLIRDLKLIGWKIISLSEFLSLHTRQTMEIAPKKFKKLTVGNLFEMHSSC
jgi:hypothetical protein